ncbi:hypothetical protein OF829_19145 [Sphingomonas sp. LB-2]|uniref:hypothetical protein n=1 Tax=Sphingomonas caeni TaxID=2984949 RepID=UPI00222F40C4|nr:hypothetical protein [Sphingomonas caeni]MCW3849361.1 hypothetical protein [Sphingomonas caeni]
MNRRQVLFGAGATALAFSGFVPWASAETLANAPISTSVTFEAFTMGIRGTYTLNGVVAGLAGIIPPLVPGATSGRVTTAVAPAAIVQEPAAPAPAITAPVQAPAPVQAAPARPPMMSIVPVQRGSRAAQPLD